MASGNRPTLKLQISLQNNLGCSSHHTTNDIRYASLTALVYGRTNRSLPPLALHPTSCLGTFCTELSSLIHVTSHNRGMLFELCHWDNYLHRSLHLSTGSTHRTISCHQPTMPETNKVSPFFGLPLELREEIYKTVLSSPNQGSDMLRTCHEIQGEAQKFLYQKPLIFRSQGSLYTWIEQAPHELLTHVSEISLHVQDVDLKSILSNSSTSPQLVPPSQLSTSELYRSEVGRITESLKAVPKLKTITIQALSIQSSFLYRGFLTQVLEALGTSCPNLLKLCLKGSFHHQELHFLTALKQLESLAFDGFSGSSPAATVDVLASLNNLRNLSLVSEHALLTPTLGVHSGFPARRQSFTGEVIRTIRQLASFSVMEQVPMTSPTLFFISEVLGSLHDHKTLKSLSIQLSHTPDTETLSSLEDFLERASIEHLELDWPDLEPGILEQYRLLSGSINVLWVRAKSMADAFEILWSIVESRVEGDLSHLGKVVLVRSTRCLSDVQNEATDNWDTHAQMSDLDTCNVSVNPYRVSPLRRANEAFDQIGFSRMLILADSNCSGQPRDRRSGRSEHCTSEATFA